MNANEIVKVLRACGNGDSACEKCPFYIGEDSSECRFNAIYEAADLIESLQAQLAESQRREKAAVDDLNLLAGESISSLTCSICKYNPNDMGCELDGSQFDDDGDCHFEWRGPPEGLR